MESRSSEIWSHITLDVRSKIPFFEQIAAQIRVNIVSGNLQSEDQLPTVRQLASILQINFNTVARAYRLLEMEDLISTQQGRGTFVLPPRQHPSPEETRQKHLAELAQRIAGLVISAGFTLEEINAYLSPKANPVTEREPRKKPAVKKASRIARSNTTSRIIRSDPPAKRNKKRVPSSLSLRNIKNT